MLSAGCIWDLVWTWQKLDQEEETVWDAIRAERRAARSPKLHPNGSLGEETGTYVLLGKIQGRAGCGRPTGLGARAGCGRRSPRALRPCNLAGGGDLGRSHLIREGRALRRRAGDPGEVLGGVARRSCRSESKNVQTHRN